MLPEEEKTSLPPPASASLSFSSSLRRQGSKLHCLGKTKKLLIIEALSVDSNLFLIWSDGANKVLSGLNKVSFMSKGLD